MNLTEYSQSVVVRSVMDDEDGVGVIDIAMIIGIVLPILANLPCLQPKSPAEKRQWVEDHPGLATAHAAREIRRQAKGKGEKVARKHSKELAQTVIGDYLATPDNDIRSMGIGL